LEQYVYIIGIITGVFLLFVIAYCLFKITINTDDNNTINMQIRDTILQRAGYVLDSPKTKKQQKIEVAEEEDEPTVTQQIVRNIVAADKLAATSPALVVRKASPARTRTRPSQKKKAVQEAK